MALQFYGLKTCDSCRAALKALENAGLRTDIRDVREDGVPEELLRQALERHGADRLVNRRSTTWRGLDEAARAGDPVDLIRAYPTLMKRPLIVSPDGAVIIGWDADARSSLNLT